MQGKALRLLCWECWDFLVYILCHLRLYDSWAAAQQKHIYKHTRLLLQRFDTLIPMAKRHIILLSGWIYDLNIFNSSII